MTVLLFKCQRKRRGVKKHDDNQHIALITYELIAGRYENTSELYGFPTTFPLSNMA